MKKILLPLIFILLLTFTLIGNCAWLDGWDYRIEFKIEDYASDIGAEVTWFPATIFLTATQGEEVFVELTTDAEYLKVAFTKADGTTELFGEKELFDVSEELGIFHVSRDGWVINANTSIFLYYDKDHADNTEYISDSVSVLTEESAIDDVYCHQGVATDGTYFYTTSSHVLRKYNMIGELLDSNSNTHTDGTDVEQTNHIHMYNGNLYLGANNYSTTPKLGYIKVFDADTLDYVEEHQVLTYWTEGCAFYDNAWWVVYSDYKYVSKYNTDWEWQADYAVDYPTTGDAGIIGYQGITWMGDDIFCSIHEDTVPSPCVDRYHWTGSGFEKRERITPPADATQGICYLVSDNRFYLAQRNHPELGKHSVTVTELDSATAAGQVWDKDFKMVQHGTDTTTSTITDSTANNNDGTKKGANEPTEATGKVGQGQDFDDSDVHSAYINCGNFLDSAANVTIEAILNPESCDADDDIVTKGKHAGSEPLVIWRDETTTDHLAVIITDDNTDTTGVIYSNYDFGSSGYIHTAITFQGGNATGLRAYFNGVEDTGSDFPADVSTVNEIASSADSIVIGDAGIADAGNKVFDGIIDEVRISTSVRNAAWIKATYNSLWDALLTYGSEETEEEEEDNAIFFGMNF